MTTHPPTPVAVTNANRIRDEIASINPDAALVIVTKRHSLEMVRTLFDAGFLDFGENRVGQFVERQQELPEARWHFIGRLSRKNTAKVVGKAELIHSVGSIELLEKIERSCSAAETQQRVLLQVNTSGEEEKQGFSPHELREFVPGFTPSGFPHVQIEGLMAMAPFTNNESVLRATFSTLREFRDALNSVFGLGWTELSMGMSNDYKIALEEGATMVRLGTVVFL